MEIAMLANEDFRGDTAPQPADHSNIAVPYEISWFLSMLEPLLGLKNNGWLAVTGAWKDLKKWTVFDHKAVKIGWFKRGAFATRGTCPCHYLGVLQPLGRSTGGARIFRVELQHAETQTG